MKIKQELFGKLDDGREVIKYKLINDNLQVNIINYGGIITELYAPDKEGKRENIVLGFDNLEDYIDKSPYFGAIIGRHAGRIEQASFKLEGQPYKLAQNEGEHNLHGGIEGLDKKLWQAKEIENGLLLNYSSPHLEEGFPGKVEFEIKYLLKGDSLEIEYKAIPDRKTIINLTNHSYFNLTGNCKDDILNHKLLINAEEFLKLDQDSIPTGEIKQVAGSAFDFREFKRIGAEIESSEKQLEFTDGYDHPFILAKKEPAVILKEEESGRIMKMTTDQAVVVFYAGNKLGPEGLLNGGVKSKARLGLCLEAQAYPNAVNLAKFPTRIYTPEDYYSAETVYQFLTE